MIRLIVSPYLGLVAAVVSQRIWRRMGIYLKKIDESMNSALVSGWQTITYRQIMATQRASCLVNKVYWTKTMPFHL